MEQTQADAEGSDAGGEPADRERLGAVLAGFGFDAVADARVMVEGLMNRNWAVTTTSGDKVFVKQVQDVEPDQARRQHVATRSLAAAGLPVAAPLLGKGGESLLRWDGGWWAVYPWVEGRPVRGVDMALGQAARLGEVLAGIHRGLGGVLPDTPSVMTMPVRDSASAKHAFDTYTALVSDRAEPDAFDTFVVNELGRRRRLLEAVELCGRTPPPSGIQ